MTHEEVLKRWFAFSGWNMERLIVEIERTESGRRVPGLDAGLVEQVTAGITNPAWVISVVRAVQHMAIVRPWLKQSAQAEMFS